MNGATLFADSEVFQTERPTKPSASQLEQFYSEQANKIIQHRFSTSDKETIISDLKALYPFNQGGYHMAKELEHGNASYQIDTWVCEFLDTVGNDLRGVCNQNVRDWVKAHNPQPKFKDGEQLLVEEAIAKDMPKGAVVYVRGKHESEAKYVVIRPGFIGAIVPYERLEKCCVIAGSN